MLHLVDVCPYSGSAYPTGHRERKVRKKLTPGLTVGTGEGDEEGNRGNAKAHTRPLLHTLPLLIPSFGRSDSQSGTFHSPGSFLQWRLFAVWQRWLYTQLATPSRFAHSREDLSAGLRQGGFSFVAAVGLLAAVVGLTPLVMTGFRFAPCFARKPPSLVSFLINS